MLRMETREDGNGRMCVDSITWKRIINAVHLFTVLFVILILYLAISGEFVFFTWHPILMAVGWVLLLTEGVLTLNKENAILKDIVRSNRVLFHWILQTTGLILITIGFLVVFKNKTDKNKSHFKTWHGIFGLLGIVFALPSGLNGVLTLYNKELKNVYSPKLNKFVHVLIGTLAYIFGGVSAVLSVYSKWFERRISDNSVFAIAVVLSASIIFCTSIRPINNISKSFQRLISM